MITDCRKFTTKITLYGISSFHFSTFGINSKSFPWNVHCVRETSPSFLRCPTRVDNTANNADITQSQAASHHRLLSYVTLGLVECRKCTACAQIAERFESNTVLWAFQSTQYSHLVTYCIIAWITYKLALQREVTMKIIVNVQGI